MVVTLPKTLLFETVKPTILELERINSFFDETEVIIDFARLGFSKPAGALPLALKLKEILQENMYRKITGVNIDLSIEAHSYLSYMGFFRFVGFQIGQPPGAAPGNSKYIPITYLNFADIKLNVQSPYVTHVSLIEEKASRLAHLFTFGESPYQRFLTYIFREILRNSFEHSEAESCIYYGQYWRTGAVELVIADFGIGIANSIRSKYGNHLSVNDSLLLATEPGISSKDTSPGAVNSGYGLYVLKKLARKYGNVIISANSTAVVYKHGLKDAETIELPLPGSCVIIRFGAENKAEDYESVLKKIISEGEKESALAGRYTKASTPSGNLTL